MPLTWPGTQGTLFGDTVLPAVQRGKESLMADAQPAHAVGVLRSAYHSIAQSKLRQEALGRG